MFTLCYYASIMLPLNVYYSAINLSCYYVAIKSLLCYYYAAINFKSIFYCYYVSIIRIICARIHLILARYYSRFILVYIFNCYILGNRNIS